MGRRKRRRRRRRRRKRQRGCISAPSIGRGFALR